MTTNFWAKGRLFLSTIGASLALAVFEVLFSSAVWIQSGGVVFYRNLHQVTTCAPITVHIWLVTGCFIVLELVTAAITYRNRLPGITTVVTPMWALLHLGCVLQTLLSSPADSWKHTVTIAVGILALVAGMIVARSAARVPTRDKGPALRGYLWVVGILAFILTGNGLLHRTNGSAGFFFGLTTADYFQLALIGFVALGGVPAMQQDKPLRKAFVLEMLAIATCQVLLHSVGNGAILFVMLLLLIYISYGKKAAAYAAALGAILCGAGVALLRMFMPDSYMMTRLANTFTVLRNGGSNQNHRRALLALLRSGLNGSGAGDTLYTSLNFAASNDWSFLSAASIFGAFTGLLILLCYAALALALRQRIQHSGENATLANTGNLISGLLLTQTVIHVLGSLNLIPFTGLNAPLLSVGGSSMLTTCAGIGLAIGYRVPETCFRRLPNFMGRLARLGARIDILCQGLVKRVKAIFAPKKRGACSR